MLYKNLIAFLLFRSIFVCVFFSSFLRHFVSQSHGSWCVLHSHYFFLLLVDTLHGLPYFDLFIRFVPLVRYESLVQVGSGNIQSAVGWSECGSDRWIADVMAAIRETALPFFFFFSLSTKWVCAWRLPWPKSESKYETLLSSVQEVPLVTFYERRAIIKGTVNAQSQSVLSNESKFIINFIILFFLLLSFCSFVSLSNGWRRVKLDALFSLRDEAHTVLLKVICCRCARIKVKADHQWLCGALYSFVRWHRPLRQWKIYTRTLLVCVHVTTQLQTR